MSDFCFNTADQVKWDHGSTGSGFHFKKGGDYPIIQNGRDSGVSFPYRLPKTIRDERIIKLAEETDISLSEYGKYLLTILIKIIRTSRTNLSDISLNMYYEPAMIILNNFLGPIEEISKQLKYPVKKELVDIQLFFEKCYEEFKNNLINNLYVSNHLYAKEPYYFDSVDIFAVLVLVYWSIIVDSENSKKYNLELQSFLKEYFTPPERFSSNINLTNKSKFRFIFEREMTNADFYFPSLKFDDIDDITTKEKEKISELLIEEFNKTKDENRKIVIIEKLGEQTYEKYQDFLIKCFKKETERLQKFVVREFRKIDDLSNSTNNYFHDILEGEDSIQKNLILEIIENKSISFQESEQEINYLFTEKRYDELLKFEDSNELLEKIMQIFTELEIDNITEAQEINELSKVVSSIVHKDKHQFLVKLVNIGNFYAKRAAIEALGNSDTEESASLLISIFENGSENETSEIGDSDSKILATLALGKLKNEEAIDKLLKILGDSDELKSFNCKEGWNIKPSLLQNFYDNKRLPYKDEFKNEYNAIIIALVSLQDKKITDKLLSFMSSSTDEKNKIDILANLSGVIDEESLLKIIDSELKSKDNDYGYKLKISEFLSTLETEKAIEYSIDILENHSTLYKLILNKEDDHPYTDVPAYKKMINAIIKFLESQKSTYNKILDEFNSYLYLYYDERGYNKPIHYYRIQRHPLKSKVDNIQTKEILETIVLLGMLYSNENFDNRDHDSIRKQVKEFAVYLRDKPPLRSIMQNFGHAQSFRKKLITNKLTSREGPRSKSADSDLIVECLLRLTNDYNLFIRRQAIKAIGEVENEEYFKQITDRLLELINTEKDYFIHFDVHLSLITFFVPSLRGEVTNDDEARKIVVNEVDGEYITVDRLWDCDDKNQFSKIITKLLERKIKSKKDGSVSTTKPKTIDEIPGQKKFLTEQIKEQMVELTNLPNLKNYEFKLSPKELYESEMKMAYQSRDLDEKRRKQILEDLVSITHDKSASSQLRILAMNIVCNLNARFINDEVKKKLIFPLLNEEDLLVKDVAIFNLVGKEFRKEDISEFEDDLLALKEELVESFYRYIEMDKYPESSKYVSNDVLFELYNTFGRREKFDVISSPHGLLIYLIDQIKEEVKDVVYKGLKSENPNIVKFAKEAIEQIYESGS